ncbi:hypothetical protein Tco_0966971 [Tanacetum coccineum]
MDNNILSNKEWKESDYGNLLNTTTDSFFKAYDERNIKEGNELRQMKRKRDNKIDEQPIKRVCKAEKFEVIKYSLGPNEEYIAIRRCEYNTWERNEESTDKRVVSSLMDTAYWMIWDNAHATFFVVKKTPQQLTTISLESIHIDGYIEKEASSKFKSKTTNLALH